MAPSLKLRNNRMLYGATVFSGNAHFSARMEEGEGEEEEEDDEEDAG